MVAPSCTAASRSPRFAGGWYSAGRIFFAAGRSRLGPRKTMIFCMIHPFSPAFRVHCKDFEPRNNHSHDWYPYLFAGQVNHDDPVETLSAQCFYNKPDIGEE